MTNKSFINKLLKSIIILLTISIMISCSSIKVKPWEKGILARQDMTIDSDLQDINIDDHIYFSKEGSSGGRGFAGGGCGCN